VDADFVDLPPLVAPTTLNVVRFTGRYLNMMVYLPHIAFDIALGLAQLFDFYQYAMYAFFGAPPTEPPGAANTLSRSTTTPNYYATSSYVHWP
jgi:hypothetical protein